ncbi:MAG: Rieske 2Fe-2S domain-containing protein [Actinomycetota bacterium]
MADVIPASVRTVNAEADAVARRYWHAVAFESQLDDGPIAVTLLGEELVVVRLGDEVLAAPDRCPHRSSRLSTGDVRIEPNGASCLVCPYHALHFDAGGRAVHLPPRPQDRLAARLDLPSLPVCVKHGMVWVSLSPDPIGGLPDWPSYDDPAMARFQLGPEPWATMPSRIVENFNDLGHFATVHAATFGVSDDERFVVVPPVDAKVVADVGGRPTGLEQVVEMHQLDRQTLDGPLVPILAEFAYRHVFPFVTELRITYAPDRIEWIQVAFTPVSSLASEEPRAMVFQQNVRNFDVDVDADIDAWHDFQAAVNAEDREILEVLRPIVIGVDGTGADEASLSFDDVTVAYRRLWREAVS